MLSVCWSKQGLLVPGVQLAWCKSEWEADEIKFWWYFGERTPLTITCVIEWYSHPSSFVLAVWIYRSEVLILKVTDAQCTVLHTIPVFTKIRQCQHFQPGHANYGPSYFLSVAWPMLCETPFSSCWGHELSVCLWRKFVSQISQTRLQSYLWHPAALVFFSLFFTILNPCEIMQSNTMGMSFTRTKWAACPCCAVSCKAFPSWKNRIISNLHCIFRPVDGFESGPQDRPLVSTCINSNEKQCAFVFHVFED